MKKQQSSQNSKKKVSFSDVLQIITKPFKTSTSKNKSQSNDLNDDCNLNKDCDDDYDEYIKSKTIVSDLQHDNDGDTTLIDENINEEDNAVAKSEYEKPTISTSKNSSSFSASSQSSQAHPETNFFYTNDKFINAFEDDEIILSIQEKYPMFKDIDTDDTMMRKTIIDMLNDSKFMVKLLKYYNMTIFDFIKFLYRQEPSLFKGQFVKRIQKSLKYKKYVSNDKKQAFRYSPKRKAKVRRLRR